MLLQILRLAVLVSACCGKSAKYRIYGGDVVPQVNHDPATGIQIVKNTGEFPYIVALEQLQQHTCGGSLLKTDVVITAAHCVDGIEPSAITVRAGGVLIVEDSVNVQIKKVQYYAMHEHYDRELNHNDIALVKTCSPFNLNSIVKPINLPSPNDSFYGRYGVAIGWGETESAQLSYVLKKTTLTIITKTQCATDYQPISITTHMICGIDKVQRVRGICVGDSGGPLVIHNPKNSSSYTLMGVASWVSKPNQYCDTRFPSVFADVVRLRSWIVKKLKTM